MDLLGDAVRHSLHLRDVGRHLLTTGGDALLSIACGSGAPVAQRRAVDRALSRPHLVSSVPNAARQGGEAVVELPVRHEEVLAGRDAFGVWAVTP